MGQTQAPEQHIDLESAFKAMKAALVCWLPVLESQNVCADLIRDHMSQQQRVSSPNDKLKFIQKGLMVLRRVQHLISAMGPWMKPLLAQLDECARVPSFPNQHSFSYNLDNDWDTTSKQKIEAALKQMQEQGACSAASIRILAPIIESRFPGTMVTSASSKHKSYEQIRQYIYATFNRAEMDRQRYVAIAIDNDKDVVCVVVDIKKRTIDMFDAKGQTFERYEGLNKFETALEEWSGDKRYQLKTHVDLHMPAMFLGHESMHIHPQRSGQCLHYVILYILLKFANGWDMGEIIDYMNENQSIDVGYPTLLAHLQKGHKDDLGLTQKQKIEKVLKQIEQQGPCSAAPIGIIAPLLHSKFPRTRVTSTSVANQSYQAIRLNVYTLIDQAEVTGKRYVAIAVDNSQDVVCALVDIQKKTVDMFNPKGRPFKEYKDLDKFDAALKEWSIEKGYKLKSHLDVGMPLIRLGEDTAYALPQTTVLLQSETRGKCTRYVFLYIMMKFQHDWDMETIIDHMNRDPTIDTGYPSLLVPLQRGLHAKTAPKRKNVRKRKRKSGHKNNKIYRNRSKRRRLLNRTRRNP